MNSSRIFIADAYPFLRDFALSSALVSDELHSSFSITKNV